jgi:hypothetical protein
MRNLLFIQKLFWRETHGFNDTTTIYKMSNIEEKQLNSASGGSRNEVISMLSKRNTFIQLWGAVLQTTHILA